MRPLSAADEFDVKLPVGRSTFHYYHGNTPNLPLTVEEMKIEGQFGPVEHKFISEPSTLQSW